MNFLIPQTWAKYHRSCSTSMALALNNPQELICLEKLKLILWACRPGWKEKTSFFLHEIILALNVIQLFCIFQTCFQFSIILYHFISLDSTTTTWNTDASSAARRQLKYDRKGRYKKDNYSIDRLLSFISKTRIHVSFVCLFSTDNLKSPAEPKKPIKNKTCKQHGLVEHN